MPISQPVERELVQTRKLEFEGFLRKDGLWDIEARMRDIKCHDFPTPDRNDGVIKAGETFHDLRVRVTIDNDAVIKKVEVALDLTPFAVCPMAENAFDGLIGLSLGIGFRKKMSEALESVKTCTHIREIISYLPNVVFQTLWIVRKDNINRNERPPMIDTCVAWSCEGDYIKREYPKFYKP